MIDEKPPSGEEDTPKKKRVTLAHQRASRRNLKQANEVRKTKQLERRIKELEDALSTAYRDMDSAKKELVAQFDSTIEEKATEILKELKTVKSNLTYQFSSLFEKMGGVKGFTKWAKNNEGLAYRLIFSFNTKFLTSSLDEAPKGGGVQVHIHGLTNDKSSLTIEMPAENKTTKDQILKLTREEVDADSAVSGDISKED
jgi:dGTP triphosphohydrolase